MNKDFFDNFMKLDDNKFRDEDIVLAEFVQSNNFPHSMRERANFHASDIVKTARARKKPLGMMESFLEEFGLSTPEGLALMCLAEGLLRIPDKETADLLIAEKLSSGDWISHFKSEESLLINASALGLMLTGKIVSLDEDAKNNFAGYVSKLTKKTGEPFIRAAVKAAMRIMGEQFVLGRNIKEAIKRGEGIIKKNEADCYSFDMLGEGARTENDAAKYMESYANAINILTESLKGNGSPFLSSGISVKLSALCARYDIRQYDKVQKNLMPRLLELAQMAKSANINFCIDAEEADRLRLSLEVLHQLSAEESLKNWDGLGLAVQAYSKRAGDVIDAVKSIANSHNRRFMVRLVKGAYWDTEVKRAQLGGRSDFPVFTTKPATDVSYLHNAFKMVNSSKEIYPQFATHNAHTVAFLMEMLKHHRADEFEFQRLHGMGETLYHTVKQRYDNIRVRAYAPVGAHEDLLPYLVRRLLENGANTSFVHAFLNEDVPVEDVVKDPLEIIDQNPKRNEKLPVPRNMYPDGRLNSIGYDLSQTTIQDEFIAADKAFKEGKHRATSLINGEEVLGEKICLIQNPNDQSLEHGFSYNADKGHVMAAFEVASNFQKVWNDKGGAARADILEKMADALENNAINLIATLVNEAGKTFDDGIAEVREAVDFCRYYAKQARAEFAAPTALPSPAGETNELRLMGRGVFVCISPWNFPLAIFTGQIAAALAAGNTVLAKPAEQTPLIANMAVKLFYEAGLPHQALQLLLGDGEIGGALTALEDIAGVAFTGSTEVAKIINRTMAAKDGPIGVLIAETGGMNAMFVDTSALKEQVVDDVIVSAFGSAGQRCSALRVLYLPNETADEIIECLSGAMDELIIANSNVINTDIGPIIDKEALDKLNAHVEKNAGKVVKRAALQDGLNGNFFAPTIIELQSIDELEQEIFGPVLHIIRYDSKKLGEYAGALRAKKYGLTLGCHSRIDNFIDKVRDAVPAGNYYINRTMIGAIVGVQPFGGLGLSGTGPKAGGPHYIHRFATEQSISNNIAARGGDPKLFDL